MFLLLKQMKKSALHNHHHHEIYSKDLQNQLICLFLLTLEEERLFAMKVMTFCLSQEVKLILILGYPNLILQDHNLTNAIKVSQAQLIIILTVLFFSNKQKVYIYYDDPLLFFFSGFLLGG